MREHSVFHADHENNGELETFGCVQSHQHHFRCIGPKIIRIGDKAYRFQKGLHVSELARVTDKFSNVFESSGRLDGALVLELGDVATAIDDLFKNVTRSGSGNYIGLPWVASVCVRSGPLSAPTPRHRRAL